MDLWALQAMHFVISTTSSINVLAREKPTYINVSIYIQQEHLTIE